MIWNGVMPAMTTAFDESLHVDHKFVARHAQWLAANGCTGIVCLGSLGEAATLDFDEKIAVLSTVIASVGERIPVVAAISALSTAEAVRIAKAAAKAGAAGLMILPPYVYKGDWREMRAHVGAILESTQLEAMLYNNPVAYGTDFLPEQIAELASDFANLAAVKESSTDVRRVTAIRALIGDRLASLSALTTRLSKALPPGLWAGLPAWSMPSRASRSICSTWRARAKRRRLRALSLVPAAAAHGHRSQFHPAHQAGAGGAEHGLGARACSATGADRR